MRARIARYINENFDDLLVLDLKIARILGAPAPHTISSYAHLKGPRIWEKFIDGLWLWLFDEPDHCRTDFNKVSVAQSAEQRSPKP